MTYINRIDVLRFFSILLVVLFHTKSSFFSGGYIGVDIFLVISGYLIFKIFSESKYININTVLIEEQAIGRAVRLGQTKKVIVNRLIMRNTIEHDYYIRNIE